MAVEAVEQGLGYGTSYLRFGASAKLVDEQQGVSVAMSYTLLHVCEVRAICAQVVFYRLFVTYVYEYFVEYTHVRVIVHRHRHTALHHILQQSHGFEAYRFASGIGSRYEQDAVVAVEMDVERYGRFALFLQGQHQERVYGMVPLYLTLFLDVWQPRIYLYRKQCLGTYVIDTGEEVVRCGYLVDVRA